MTEYYLDVEKDAVIQKLSNGSLKTVSTNREKSIDAHKAYKKRNRLRKIRKCFFWYDLEDRCDRGILYAYLVQKERQ